jgi:hypothetical protein
MRLLSKEDWRAALPDEGIPDRPEVTIIIKPLPFACFREGWTRATSGPHWTVVGPSGLPQSEAPESSPGEEMTLGVSHKFACFDFIDVPTNNLPISDGSRLDRFAHDFALERIEVVIKCFDFPHVKILD